MSGVWRAVTEKEGYCWRNGGECWKAGGILVTSGGDPESCPKIISPTVDAVILHTP